MQILVYSIDLRVPKMSCFLLLTKDNYSNKSSLLGLYSVIITGLVHHEHEKRITKLTLVNMFC